MSKHPGKALVEKAVEQARIYFGSQGKVPFRVEVKMYNAYNKLIAKIAKVSGMLYEDVYEQIGGEANKKGFIQARPGQHY